MTRILIVDDSDDMRALLTLKLKQRFEVETLEASSGLASSEVLLSMKVDLVISDLQMPNGNGVWLHSFMLKHSPQVPLIIFTASEDEALPPTDTTLKSVIYKFDFLPLFNTIEQLGLFS